MLVIAASKFVACRCRPAFVFAGRLRQLCRLHENPGVGTNLGIANKRHVKVPV
jgi:hypothetical protein